MEDNEFRWFKWKGPLDLRKTVERTIAGIISSMFAGFFIGVGVYLSTVVGGWF